jgi:hypothetical protein
MPPDDAELQALRELVEALLRELTVRVLENAELLALLVDRDATIEQLERERDSLAWELRQATISPKRASAFARSLALVLGTAQLAVGTVGAGATIEQLRMMANAPPPAVQQTTIVIDQCDAVIRAADATVVQRDHTMFDDPSRGFDQSTFGGSLRSGVPIGQSASVSDEIGITDEIQVDVTRPDETAP